MIYGCTRIHRKRETNKKSRKKNRRNKFQAASKKLRVAKSRQIIMFPGYTSQKSRYWSNHVSTHIFLDSHGRNKENAKTTVSSHKSTKSQKPSHNLACNKNSELSTHEKQRSRARNDDSTWFHRTQHDPPSDNMLENQLARRPSQENEPYNK